MDKITEQPLVSILMTAYNREKYIVEAIESVLKSTYQNWELIIVDDVSQDNTVAIAKQYELLDTRIKVYINESNLGDYPNRNKAATYSKGKYLKYIDADDMIYPHGLQVMVNYMEQFPEAGWGLMSLKDDYTRVYPYMINPREAYLLHYFKGQLFHKAPLSAIIKKDVFNKVGGFSEVSYYGDTELWHRLAKHYHLVLMHYGLVWWRYHLEQESKIEISKPWISIERIIAVEEHIRSGNCPLNANERKIILQKFRNYKIGKIIQQIKICHISMALRLVKMAKLFSN